MEVSRRNFLLIFLFSLASYFFKSFIPNTFNLRPSIINVKVARIPSIIKEFNIPKGTKLKEFFWKEYQTNIKSVKLMKDKSGVDKHGRIIKSSMFILLTVISGHKGCKGIYKEVREI